MAIVNGAGMAPENEPGGKPIKKRGDWLTLEVVKKLKSLWEISGPDTLTDEEIADRIGITQKQLKAALRRGTLFDLGDDTRASLKAIRTRARGQTKSWYLQEIIQSGIEARKAFHSALKDSDYRGAASLSKAWQDAFKWLAERQFPKTFHLARMELDSARKSPADVANEINDMLKAMDASVPHVSAMPQ